MSEKHRKIMSRRMKKVWEKEKDCPETLKLYALHSLTKIIKQIVVEIWTVVEGKN